MPSNNFPFTFTNLALNNNKNRVFYNQVELDSNTLFNVSRIHSDLLRGRTFGSPQFASNFAIDGPKQRLDKLASEAVQDLGVKLESLAQVPTADEVASNDIQWVLENFSGSETVNKMKALLQREALTGIITQVTNRLNKSKLQATDRFLLSNRGIYIYILYRVLVGMQIEEIEAVIENVSDSIKVAKSHINLVLVDKVIEVRNLDTSSTLLSKLKARVKDLDFPYEVGIPENLIADEYRKEKSGGTLIEIVEIFLNSEDIQLDSSINRILLRDKMVEYLIRIGFDPSGAEDPSTLIGKPSPTAPAENAVFTAQTVDFVWSEVENAELYTLQVGDHPDNWTEEQGFESGATKFEKDYDTESSTVAFDPPLDPGHFYWTIRAISAIQVDDITGRITRTYGLFSAPRKFSIQQRQFVTPPQPNESDIE